ncbi:septation protein A [Paludibacterium paludis]|uniref:Inner membrane-spanning protein YciB n=1 Tax=Paludibacterium paludis TaxID=1225769 RepID=A0A918P4Q0_9NEIS|nr:septation protein A [Paludibacterium paludis]GGY19264.1 putative intracellular septation protein A [Paludibacterium paludis]
MKFIVDFLGILLFFGAYWWTNDIFVATGIAIVTTVLQVGYALIRRRPVDKLQWLTLGLVVVLGGATLLLHDKHFIMWKPTVLYGLMGAGLVVGQLAGKNGIRAVMETQVSLPDRVWTVLCHAWGVFFIALAALNLFVAYTFSERIWVNFKMFGTLGLIAVFAIAQSFALSRYVQDE